MSTHPPIPTKKQKALLRPLSTRRHRRIHSPSLYKPGNILAPVSTQRSMFYQVRASFYYQHLLLFYLKQPTLSRNDTPTHRTYGQLTYRDIISNPEYFGRPFVQTPGNIQVKSTSLPPITRHQK